MQFLAICRRRTEAFPPEAFDALLEAEAQAVRAFYATGVVRNAWSREDVLGACLLLELTSLEEATKTVASFPLAVHGMLDIQIIPVKGYRGFAPANRAGHKSG